MITIGNHTDREEIISDLVPDLTPLLDVMFMLIVFLVLTTNTMQQVFDVTLPEDQDGVTELLSEQETIKVTIFPESGQWGINEQKYSDYDGFKRALLVQHQAQPMQKIIIYGDQSVTIERLMKLLTFLRSQNIETADIVME